MMVLQVIADNPVHGGPGQIFRLPATGWRELDIFLLKLSGSGRIQGPPTPLAPVNPGRSDKIPLPFAPLPYQNTGDESANASSSICCGRKPSIGG
jgi:hypothetical protein